MIIVNTILKTIVVTFTTHNRQTSVPAPGFKPEIPATKGPQTAGPPAPAPALSLYSCANIDRIWIIAVRMLSVGGGGAVG